MQKNQKKQKAKKQSGKDSLWETNHTVGGVDIELFKSLLRKGIDDDIALDVYLVGTKEIANIAMKMMIEDLGLDREEKIAQLVCEFSLTDEDARKMFNEAANQRIAIDTKNQSLHELVELAVAGLLRLNAYRPMVFYIGNKLCTITDDAEQGPTPAFLTKAQLDRILDHCCHWYKTTEKGKNEEEN